MQDKPQDIKLWFSTIYRSKISIKLQNNKFAVGDGKLP